MTLVLLPPPGKKVKCGIDGCRRCIFIRGLSRHIGRMHGRDRIEKAREFISRTTHPGISFEGEVNELVIYADELALQLARPLPVAVPVPVNHTPDPWTFRGES